MSLCVHVDQNSTECASHGLCNCVSSLLWKIEQDSKANGIDPMTATQCIVKGCMALAFKGGFCHQHVAALGGQIPGQQGNNQNFLLQMQNPHLQQQQQQHQQQQQQQQHPSTALQIAYQQQQQAVAAAALSRATNTSSGASSVNTSSAATDSYWKPSNFEQFKQEVFKLPGNVNDLLQPFTMESKLVDPVTGNKAKPMACSWGTCMNNATINGMCQQHAAKFSAGQRPEIASQQSFMASLAEAVGDTTSFTNMLKTGHNPSVPSQPQRVGPKKNYKACQEPGCTKYAQRQGLCRNHEKMKNGEPLNTRSAVGSGRLYRMCCYPDCEKHSQKYHVCRTHEKLMIDQAKQQAGPNGDYEPLFKQMLQSMKICRHPSGCNNVIRAKGFCTEHLPESLRVQHALAQAQINKSPSNFNDLKAIAKRKQMVMNENFNKKPRSQLDEFERSNAAKMCLHLDCNDIAGSLGYCKVHERVVKKNMTTTESGKVLYYIPSAGGIATGNSNPLSKKKAPNFNSKKFKKDPRTMGYSPFGNEEYSPKPDTCSKRGCEEAPVLDGTCEAHYVRRCDLDKCTRKADVRGLCLLHRKATLCQVPDCNVMVISRSFCPNHLKYSKCTVIDCANDAIENEGHCEEHKDAKKCSYAPCVRFAAVESSFCEAHVSAKQCATEDCDEWILYDTTMCEDHGGKAPPAIKLLSKGKPRIDSNISSVSTVSTSASLAPSPSASSSSNTENNETEEDPQDEKQSSSFMLEL